MPPRTGASFLYPVSGRVSHEIDKISAVKTGHAVLPLHGGRAPRWLFERLVRLARGVSPAIVETGGPRELLRRLSDPFWFQAFGGVPGFDWHSSGVTPAVFGALKEALAGLERDSGIHAAGGKDGHPCPVDRATCDRSAEYLREAVRRARIGHPARLRALRALDATSPGSASGA